MISTEQLELTYAFLFSTARLTRAKPISSTIVLVTVSTAYVGFTKSVTKQTYFSLSVSNSYSDSNGLPVSPIRTPNIRVKNRLDEAWARIETTFYENTKQSLGSYDVKRKDSVVKRFVQRYEAECQDKGMRSSSRADTLLRVLKAIELVGAFAAAGVSIVFGPTNLVFNAITLLIDAPRQIIKSMTSSKHYSKNLKTSLLNSRSTNVSKTSLV